MKDETTFVNGLILINHLTEVESEMNDWRTDACTYVLSLNKH